MRIKKRHIIIFFAITIIYTPFYSFAAQWPVAEFLTEGSLNAEGKLTGTVGDSSNLSSDFGPRNVPGSRMHGGIDIPVPTGTPVYAAVTGIVKKKGENGGHGYQIVIEGVDGRFHSYNHLFKDKYSETYPPKVYKNDKVTEGQQIGWSNDSGFSQGPHLDYKVYTKDNGRILYVNPLSVLPYVNNETPRVSIEKPEDGSEVGTDEKNREAEVNINVKTSEKDLTEVDLFIDSNRPPGVDFNFERKGRKKVSIEKGGTLYVYKSVGSKWKWWPATEKEKKNNKSYVQAGYVDAGTGSNDTFIYKWDTKAFLASKKVKFKENVPIKVLAHQAKGSPGTKQIRVDVGTTSPLIDTLEIEKGILVAQTRYTKESPGLKSKLKPKEEGGKLTEEILEGRAVFKTASTVSEWTPDITINPDGTADLSAQTSGLEDGPHTAVIEILDENGNVTDSKQKLFYVDTKPPKLELLEPEGSEILHTQGSFMVKFNDEESGIPSVVEEMDIEARINNKIPFLLVTEKQGERFLVIKHQGDLWQPEQDVNLFIKIKDRAGNEAEIDRSFKVSPLVEKETKKKKCYGKTNTASIVELVPFKISETQSSDIPLKIDFSLNYDHEIYNDLTKLFLDSVILTSNHSALKVAKEIIEGDSPAVRLTVTQTQASKPGDTAGSVTFEYPEALSLKGKDICAYYMTSDRMPAVDGDRPLPDLIMRSFKIFVPLYSETPSFSEDIFVEDELLKYKLSSDVPGSIDTAASWFEVDGERCWLKEEGDGVYEAKVPAKEGKRSLKIGLASARSIWNDVEGAKLTNSKTIIIRDAQYFVKLDPPLIEDFLYDSDEEKFKGAISDKGTELFDLNVKLTTEGGEEIPVLVDSGTGELEADYPLPEGVKYTVLSVVDLADQNAYKTLKVYGKPPEPEYAEGENGNTVIIKKNIKRSKSYDQLYPPYNVYREYLEFNEKGKQRVKECKLHYAWRYTNEEIMQMMQQLNASGIKNPRIPEWQCSYKWMDTLPPKILNFVYDPAGQKVTAVIDDSGMPLSGLKIDFSVNSAYPSTLRYRTNPPFSFNTTTGSFSGNFAIPSEGELYNLVIIATDRAGHSARASVNITAPRKPPDVSLRVIDMEGQRYYFSGTQAKVYLSGQCYDESGINRDKTRIWIDDHPLQPLSINRGWSEHTDWGYEFLFCANLEEGQHTARFLAFDNAGLSAEDTVVFNVSFSPVIRDFKAHPTSLQLAGGPAFSAVITDQGKDLKKEGLVLEIDGASVPSDRLYYDPSSGYFAADGPFDFTGGRHQARVVATDDHGNRSEKQLSFVPGEKLILAGDDTKELNVDSFTLWEIENHNGDGKANPGELIRAFITLRNTGDYSLNGITARLFSEENLVTVEEDSVDYNSIDAGDAPFPVKGFDLRISREIFNTTSKHPFNARLNLKVTDDSGKEWSFPFTLPVYRATIPAAGFVTVEIDPLPRNTEQSQIEITGKATSTAAGIDRVAVYVNGQNYNARWDYSESRFSSSVNLVAGSNVIEVQATDKSGNLGSKTVFITRSSAYVPPEVTITFPVNGTSYPACSHFIMTGTFSTGSSGLASLSAVFIAGGSSGIPLVINGNSFESTVEVSEYPDGGDITVGVTLTTTAGNEASDTVSYDVGPCL